MSAKAILLIVGALVLGYLYMASTTESTHVQQCDIALYPSYVEQINGAGCKEILNMDFSKFDSLKRVDLGNANLKEIPRGLPLTVEILLLGGNPQIKEITNVENLSSLRILALRGCGVQSVDGSALPQSLLSLVLTENAVNSVKNLRHSNLVKLMLSHNKLTTISDLPESLELLRLANNPELAFPAKLFNTLPRLRWLACSSTVVSRSAPIGASRVKLDVVDLADLSDRQKIGSGASGVVYSSKYKGRSVAIKFFKKSSSDGNSNDELEVMRHIKHFDIVSPVAILKGDSGLLVNLVPDAQSLGSPPTFDTVVRNVKKITITQPLLVHALLSISAAMAHLHKIGIAHGDLYAHNIIFSKDSNVVKLSDFGASWFIPRQFQEAMEDVEVRAFGALVEDLLSWMDPEDIESPAAVAAIQISERCHQLPTPRFAELEEMSKKIHRQRALDKIEGYKKAAAAAAAAAETL